LNTKTRARIRKAVLLLACAPLLMAAKCGEATNDDGPEKLTGTIGLKFGPDVPATGTGKKCTYGGMWVTSTEGKWYVCAPNQKTWDDAKEGDTFTR
jgi:hypothetical protein